VMQPEYGGKITAVSAESNCTLLLQVKGYHKCTGRYHPNPYNQQLGVVQKSGVYFSAFF